jgi:gluconate kinase
MPPELLDSQLAILEYPNSEEEKNVYIYDISNTPHTIVTHIMETIIAL